MDRAEFTVQYIILITWIRDKLNSWLDWVFVDKTISYIGFIQKEQTKKRCGLVNQKLQLTKLWIIYMLLWAYKFE
jgi:hypothetical protein